MRIERRLLKFITRTNWIIIALVVVAGCVYAPGRFALGILAGGLIVTVNFQLLYRSLKQSLTPHHLTDHRTVLGKTLGKYYIRLIVTAIIIFVLIAKNLVNPIGLIIGLSVVVTSVFVATLNEIRKIIFKEAA